MSTSNTNNMSSSTSNATITTSLNITTLTTTLNTITSANATPAVTNVTPVVTNVTPVTNVVWNEREIRLLIDQRQHRNTEYYQIVGRSRKRFWDSVARRINRAAGSHFTGKQCKRKFQNLVSAYYVSKIDII
jgi:hypothetical protein